MINVCGDLLFSKRHAYSLIVATRSSFPCAIKAEAFKFETLQSFLQTNLLERPTADNDPIATEVLASLNTLFEGVTAGPNRQVVYVMVTQFLDWKWHADLGLHPG